MTCKNLKKVYLWTVKNLKKVQRRSRRVAYAIMDYMQECNLLRNDIAEKLGVSPQYVSKILSGKVNFSFKAITEIEESFGKEVFLAAAMEA